MPNTKTQKDQEQQNNQHTGLLSTMLPSMATVPFALPTVPSTIVESIYNPKRLMSKDRVNQANARVADFEKSMNETLSHAGYSLDPTFEGEKSQYRFYKNADPSKHGIFIKKDLHSTGERMHSSPGMYIRNESLFSSDYNSTGFNDYKARRASYKNRNHLGKKLEMSADHGAAFTPGVFAHEMGHALASDSKGFAGLVHSTKFDRIAGLGASAGILGSLGTLATSNILANKHLLNLSDKQRDNIDLGATITGSALATLPVLPEIAASYIGSKHVKGLKNKAMAWSGVPSYLIGSTAVPWAAYGAKKLVQKGSNWLSNDSKEKHASIEDTEVYSCLEKLAGAIKARNKALKNAILEPLKINGANHHIESFKAKGALTGLTKEKIEEVNNRIKIPNASPELKAKAEELRKKYKLEKDYQLHKIHPGEFGLESSNNRAYKESLQLHRLIDPKYNYNPHLLPNDIRSEQFNNINKYTYRIPKEELLNNGYLDLNSSLSDRILKDFNKPEVTKDTSLLERISNTIRKYPRTATTAGLSVPLLGAYTGYKMTNNNEKTASVRDGITSFLNKYAASTTVEVKKKKSDELDKSPDFSPLAALTGATAGVTANTAYAIPMIKQMQEETHSSLDNSQLVYDMLERAGYKRQNNSTTFTNKDNSHIVVPKESEKTLFQKATYHQAGPHAAPGVDVPYEGKTWLGKWLNKQYNEGMRPYTIGGKTTVNIGKGNSEAIAAHELGHAITMNKRSLINRIANATFRLGSYPATILGATAGIAASNLAFDDDTSDKIDKTLAYGHAALAAPTLAQELEASWVGSKYMKNPTWRNRIKAFKGIPSYATLMGVPIMAYGAKKLYQNHIRDNNKDK